MLDKFKALKEQDPKKYGAYLACIIISVITVVLCCIVIIVGTNPCEHEYKVIEEIAPTYNEEGKAVEECSLCGSRKTKTLPVLAPPSYIEGVDYEEIYKAYKENPIRAEEKYKGNRYRITGQINGMSTSGLLNVTGGATLTMLIKIDNTYVYFVAEFEKDQVEALKTVNVGDTITFEGKCASDELWTKCELIK